MATFKTNVVKKQFWLPSTKDLPDNDPDKAYVVLDIGAPRTQDFARIEDGLTSGERLVCSVMNRIIEWNYVDEEGNRIPINLETVSMLDTNDFLYLNDKLNKTSTGLSDEEKKTTETTLEVPTPSTLIPQ